MLEGGHESRETCLAGGETGLAIQQTWFGGREAMPLAVQARRAIRETCLDHWEACLALCQTRLET